MKTLLLALLSPGKSKSTREGAVRGLVGVGKEAVRKGLIEGGGARIIGSECAGSGGSVENAQLVGAVMVRLLLPSTTTSNLPLVRAVLIFICLTQDAFRLLATPSSQPRPLHPSNPDDAAFMSELGSTLGPFFAARVSPDADWARTLIAGNKTGASSRAGGPNGNDSGGVPMEF